MDLKEYVKSTISQLSEAVEELNDELGDKTVVNPIRPDMSGENVIIDRKNGTRMVTDVCFELSTSIIDNKENGAKVGIFSSIVGLGANTVSGSNNSAISKVTFSIPVLLPTKNSLL